jgi:hypothetical protein
MLKECSPSISTATDGNEGRNRAELCQSGFDRNIDNFCALPRSKRLDASLPLISLAGFFFASDPRIWETFHAVEERLLIGGTRRQLGLAERPRAGKYLFGPIAIGLIISALNRVRH